MKIINVSLFIISLLFINSVELKSQEMDTVSYSIGVVLGQNLKNEGLESVDTETLTKAIQDVLSGTELAVSYNESQQIFGDYLQSQKAKVHEVNKSAGESFLSENAKNDFITVTESGLQYKVITMGEGSKPALTDKVNVHYHGTLITGEVFDSSVERGEPISFPLNGVIQGWQEGLQLMPVGSKFRFFIPQDLAYGGRGAGALIKPFSALVFDVELLGIE
jgi:FKBP-type peptidyl-prolyl cis-trans isomerase FklB